MVAVSVVMGRQATLNARLGRLETKIDLLSRHAGLSADPAFDLDDVVKHLAAGHTIQAIKSYRQATGADLVTAKRAVERMQAGGQ